MKNEEYIKLLHKISDYGTIVYKRYDVQDYIYTRYANVLSFGSNLDEIDLKEISFQDETGVIEDRIITIKSTLDISSTNYTSFVGELTQLIKFYNSNHKNIFRIFLK